MIELDDNAAGQLGPSGVRSWIVFTAGSPKKPSGARFFLFGPWDIGGEGRRYGALGSHTRAGWSLRWQTRVPGHGIQFYEVEVPRFSDIMRLAKLGPVEAAVRIEAALADARQRLGATFLRLGNAT